MSSKGFITNEVKTAKLEECFVLHVSLSVTATFRAPFGTAGCIGATSANS